MTDPDALGTTPQAPWPDDALRDRFCGDWLLWQRRRGHRTSTDDMLTAWLATRVHPEPPERYLDLGCGIGSVLLLTAHALEPGESHGVEAQEQSATMAARSVSELPASAPPLLVRCADFRQLDPARLPRYPLITGSPPYLPPGTGVPSPDPQRAACRFELRGGIEDYCATAASLLAPDGVFVVVFQSAWHDRVLDAASNAGLRETCRAELRTRASHDTDFLRAYAFRPTGTSAHAGFLPDDRHDSHGAADVPIEHLDVRDHDGQVTPKWLGVRRRLGLAP
ncbi:MAG: hypothetical protein EA398_13600 [Deltaproteobacteria bacterium]|nr:MAG: hypothetical protein EA398_13600 [Deltaproteobacteria bacterium]